MLSFDDRQDRSCIDKCALRSDLIDAFLWDVIVWVLGVFGTMKPAPMKSELNRHDVKVFNREWHAHHVTCIVAIER